MIDLTIRGGVVYDGSGSPPRRADVSIAGGVITEVGPAADVGAEVIDATNLAVAPGFIDFHSHADFTLPGYPDAINSISQGVTTEVVGNCGLSPAPLSADPELASAYQASCVGIGPDLDWRWSSFEEFLVELERRRLPVNCVPLVGHNALRSAVMGFADRVPARAELEEMRALVAAAMESGAWGMSSGLIYPPGTYAAVDELSVLAGVVAGRGGIYPSHVRNEGSGLVGAVAEAVEVGRRTGVTVQVSHLKAMGADNSGLVPEALAAIDQARVEGVAIYCDAYPYAAASTFLAMLTPGWAQEGGFDELVGRLRSREVRERIRHEMTHGRSGWNSMLAAAGEWDAIVISSVSDRRLSHYEGESIATLAARERNDPFDFTFDLLIDDAARTVMVAFLMDERDVHTVLQYPGTVIGSDQLLVTDRERKTHPRAYGSHARVLGPLVRDRGLFPLETAVHKMSGLPASILGMSDRGRVAPGMVADLVLFDPDRVTDRADYADPTAPADGIESVLLAGRTAFESGWAATPGLGKVLRRAD